MDQYYMQSMPTGASGSNKKILIAVVIGGLLLLVVGYFILSSSTSTPSPAPTPSYNPPYNPPAANPPVANPPAANSPAANPPAANQPNGNGGPGQVAISPMVSIASCPIKANHDGGDCSKAGAYQEFKELGKCLKITPGAWGVKIKAPQGISGIKFYGDTACTADVFDVPLTGGQFTAPNGRGSYSGTEYVIANVPQDTADSLMLY